MASVSSGGAMLRHEDESEAEVTREDQDNINKFARLNARLHEIRAEIKNVKVRSIPIFGVSHFGHHNANTHNDICNYCSEILKV
jgi:hypothetical protein